MAERKRTSNQRQFLWHRRHKCPREFLANRSFAFAYETQCILESAEQYLQPVSQPRLMPELAVISANSQDSLKARIEDVKNCIATNPNHSVDLCYTLSRRREHFKWRSFAVLSGAEPVTFVPPINKPTRPPTVVMVFSGQGAQWPRMGYDLLGSLPSFREDVLGMDEILQSLGDRCPRWKAIGEFVFL